MRSSSRTEPEIRTAWPHDLPALRLLFERSNHAPYDLSLVAAEKCFGAGVSGPPVTRLLERHGRVEGAAVTCGHWLRLLAVLPEARRQGVGTALLRDAESRGASIIAAEAGNYFTPGVVMSDEASRAFFHARGYIETRWTTNLEVSLPAPGRAGERSELLRRPDHSAADRVLEFVQHEFGRIWTFEVAKAFERDLPPAFIAEEEEKIVGFAVHDINNSGLGFFGPTGVASHLRGRGIGRKLLMESLADLARMGYERAVIPWTDALDFYRKSCGAEPAHRFVAFAKNQP